MKDFNIYAVMFGAIGGVVAFLFGKFDALLAALIVFVILDYITGLVKAIYNKQVSSETGYKGLIKKFLIFVIVVVAVVLQRVLNNSIPLREVVITFFICNEGISILENAAEFIPIPQKLKNVLLQLRETYDDDDDEKEK